MIDLTSETVLSFAQAAQRVPSFRAGKKTNVSTLFRWAQKGVGGIKLDSARLGGRTITSVEALQRFSDALSRERDVSTPDPIRTAPSRRKAVERAERDLAASGF